MVKWAERLSLLASVSDGHRCFYRSYLIVSALRRSGIPAEMNIGMMGFDGSATPEGHCWVTVGDRAIAEVEDPTNSYPTALGSNGRGISFWVGPTISVS